MVLSLFCVFIFAIATFSFFILGPCTTLIILSLRSLLLRKDDIRVFLRGSWKEYLPFVFSSVSVVPTCTIGITHITHVEIFENTLHKDNTI